MMPDYHIGALDKASREALAQGSPPTPESTSPRPIFLDQRTWRKTLLHSKETVSSDTRIFRFTLEHSAQTLGLPTGQHLMLRLRDPVTREAIIRSYTPISETSEPGFCDVLIKVYADTPDRAGGKMTKALDAIPVGHYVDFKGPVGKFEYLGRGLCKINGREKRVDRFYMICGGSGITPIYQVLRAVVRDREDGTRCTVLNGNRTEEDILCKEELERFSGDDQGRCTVVNSLTRAGEGWEETGRESGEIRRRGRIGEALLREWCVKKEGERALVLVCGPEALEKAAGEALRGMGWGEKEIMFF